MNCRSRKMPNALTVPGRINPQYESSIPCPPTPKALLSPKNGTRFKMM
jgi:hypothetical protein